MVASDRRLETLAADVRVADEDGRLDVSATASRLGVALQEAELGDYVEAVMFNGAIVLNRMPPSPGRRRFTFAHEVGHLLIGRRYMPWVDRRTEEWWADWFAHELIFPRRWFKERRWEQLQLFGDPAERRTLASQLASFAHAEDAVLRVDDAVVCGRCGDRQFFAGCACQRFRSDERRTRLLPALIRTELIDIDQLRLFELEDPVDALWQQLILEGSARTSEPATPARKPGTGLAAACSE